MKTLVVLAFLVGLTTAAPASQDRSLDVVTMGISSNTADLIKREKKSPLPQDAIPSTPEEASGLDMLPANFNNDGEPTASARSLLGFHKKGPIIVKKKSGYHLYRDSEEERAAADSQETCGKQMRLKVCNVNKSGKSADLAEQNAEMSNNDVESSIKLAKEAIESLQNDMQKLEESGHWKHGQSDVDTSMHHNIDTVRHALQHVQGRIGKLESMNLRATTWKDTKALDELTKGKSEEERLAQWKEAMENIQKNVELARNIEDSFKAVDNLPEANENKLAKNPDQDHKNHEPSSKSSSTNLFEEKASEDEKDKKADSEHHKISPKSSDEKHDDHEMTVAASAPIKSTIQLNSKDTGKSAEISMDEQSSSLHLNHEVNHEDKKDRDADKDSSLNKNKKEKNHEIKDNELNKETAFKTSENQHHDLDSSNSDHVHKVDSTENDQTQKDLKNKKSTHLLHGKNAWDEAQSEDTFMKAADHTSMAEKETNEKFKEELERASLKDTEKIPTAGIENEVLKQEKPTFQVKHADSSILPSHNQGFSMPGQGMHMSGHDMHRGEMDMGLAGHEMKKMHGNGMHMGNNQMHKGKHDMYMPGHGKHMQGQDMYMHGHGMQMPGHGMHMSNIPGHGMKYGKHGKSADFDNTMEPSVQMNMREAAGKSAMDKMFQWKHHDSARAAYGGSYSADAVAGGSDALGVFPNAKVGGCGIPLLLSCSPSVVRGSLAKSHSSYASPAYRNEDDFGLKKKRDIIKTKDFAVEKPKPTELKNTVTDILETIN